MRATPLLRSLPDAAIADLAGHARIVRFTAGEALFSKGTLGTHAFWIMKGRVKITTTARNGHELLLKMVEAGDVCGEISAIERGARSSNAIAESAVDALSLPGRPLTAAIEGSPGAAMDLIHILCGYLRHSVTNIETLGLHSAETRIWCRIIDLSHRYANVDPDGRAICVKHGLSQQGLADSVGLTRVMVNRQLNVWREKGLIEYRRGVIEIPDPSVFESYVWRALTNAA